MKGKAVSQIASLLRIATAIKPRVAKNNNESDMIERSKLVPHKCLACEASAKGKGKGVGNKNGGGGQGRKEGGEGSACNQSPQNSM